MKRWKKKLTASLMALAGVSGCKQQLYMTHDDHRATTIRGLPQNLETDLSVTVPPTITERAAPPTVTSTDQPGWYTSLPELFSIALESGNRGSTFLSAATAVSVGQGRAVINDDLVGFVGGRTISDDDSIRAFALDPAIIGADIEGAVSKFDARWRTSMAWGKRDDAVLNVFSNLQNGDNAAFSSGLYKPLPSGGLAGITFNTDYTRLSAVPSGFAVINPSYRPAVQFNFEQPLLRDFGIFTNQLLAAHPGTTQIAGLRASGGRSEGILLTRIRYDQSRAQFEREVALLLLNVEFAYWNLYSAYIGRYATEQGLRQSFITWHLTKVLAESGKLTQIDLAQARASFERFRSQYINSVAAVQEAERQLRGILGMSPNDGRRIIPADAPTVAPYSPDYTVALNEALTQRPELVVVRDEVKARQLDVLLQQNSLRPDLRFFANYNVNAIGTKLDGAGPDQLLGRPGNALAALSDNKFSTWNLGFSLDMPFGFRDANSAVRASQLRLARTYQSLKNQELKAERFLFGVHQSLTRYYEDIGAQRRRRMALAQQLEGLFSRFKAGRDPLLNMLVAQSEFAEALRQEHEAIANYNIAIAQYQYAKGTMLQFNNIQIAEGQLPHCALARAVEHYRQRTQGLILRERETQPTAEGGNSLPSLLEHQPPTPDALPDEKTPSLPTTTRPIVDPLAPTREMMVPSTPMGTRAPTGTQINETGQPIAQPVNRPTRER